MSGLLLPMTARDAADAVGDAVGAIGDAATDLGDKLSFWD